MTHNRRGYRNHRSHYRTEDYPPPLPQAEVRELIRLAQSPIVSLHTSKAHARQRVVLHNMRLVCSIAGQLAKWTGLEIDDLVMEGAVALHNAVEKFNLLYVGRSGRPIQFSTFASYAIRNHFIRLGRLRMRRILHEKRTDAAEILEDDSILPVFDAAGFEGPLSFPNRYGRFVDIAEVERALELIDERPRHVLLLRTGRVKPSIDIANGCPNLSEAARELGISRERVRQLEAKGLRQLAELCGFDNPASISDVG